MPSSNNASSPHQARKLLFQEKSQNAAKKVLSQFSLFGTISKINKIYELMRRRTQ